MDAGDGMCTQQNWHGTALADPEANRRVECDWATVIALVAEDDYSLISLPVDFTSFPLFCESAAI